jgi:hypothetical protein
MDGMERDLVSKKGKDIRPRVESESLAKLDCDGICLCFPLHTLFSYYFYGFISFVYEVKELNALSSKYKDFRGGWLFGFVIENSE